MKTFSSNSFAGGMNDWIHPTLLESNIASKLVNANVSDGKLVPIQRPVFLSSDPPTAYGHYGTKDRSAVKYNGRHYWSNNSASASPYYGGTPENYLGVPYPAKYTISTTSTVSNRVVFDLTTASLVESARLTGKYKYCVTYVTTNGWESAPGSLTEYEFEATLEGKNPTIKVYYASGQDIVKAKIYRTTDHGAEFYHIGTVGGTSLADRTFYDLVSDEEAVLNNPLTSQDNYPPPDGGKYLCENGGVFFLAVGSLLYFSSVGNPHAWPTTQFIAFDDVITGITPEFQGVLVFTRNNVYRVIGADDAATVQKIYIPGNHGCVSWRSIAALNNAPVWLSNDGICLWDGNSITVPSYRVIKTEKSPENIRFAATANDSYYLFLRKETIVYDIRNGGIFYKLDFSFDYAWYDVSSGIFYLNNASGVYKYGSGSNLKMKYFSPYVGGNESAMKIFYEVYIVCSGACALDVSVDGVPLLENSLSVPAGRQRIKLPRQAVGRYLALSVSSNERINEIQVLYD